MSLTFTPRQLSQRADLYHQLGQLISAGIGLPRALEIQRGSPPAVSFRKPLNSILEALTRGATFAEALTLAGRWLPSFDLALLQAGETSGRLPACFQLLARYYTERAGLARQVLSNLAYPVLLLHFAVLIGPFPSLFTSGNFVVYLGQTLGLLLPLYLVIGACAYALTREGGEQWKGALEKVLHLVPVLGSARRNMALARLSVALEALISAGVNIVEAWELAAPASGSPALRQRIVSWRPRLDQGQTPAELLAQSPEFPTLFAHLYQTAELTGQLDETLSRLHRLYQEEGSRQWRMIAEWTPRLFYFAIVIFIAYRIISFYAGYYSQLDEVLRNQ